VVQASSIAGSTGLPASCHCFFAGIELGSQGQLHPIIGQLPEDQDANDVVGQHVALEWFAECIPKRYLIE
jgi:hypothetical protein